MTVRRCRWCARPANAKATAKGLDSPIYTCDSDDCHTRTVRATRGMVPRTNQLIPQGPPDLFDHLPHEGETA